MDFTRLFRRAATKPEQRAVIFQGAEEFHLPLAKSAIAATPAAMGIPVTAESALTIPAVWAAVNFISSTLAGLPLRVYKRDGSGGAEAVEDHTSYLLNHAPNIDFAAYEARKLFWDSVLVYGRGYMYIERKGNRVHALYPLNYHNVALRVKEGRLVYNYTLHAKTVDGSARTGSTKKVQYQRDEIIDVAFMRSMNGGNHYLPLEQNQWLVAIGVAAQQYACRAFAHGGVPPMAIVGPFTSPAAIGEAGKKILGAVLRHAQASNLIMPIPEGHELKEMAAKPADMQLVETQKWVVEQVARIYSLPPVMLQDLEHGTFANTEQSDLHFVKHTLTRWVRALEGELNLRLWGWGEKAKYYCEHDMDAMLRGDYRSRMEGSARAIQSAIKTPNEIRAVNNDPPMEGGDLLYIQGATVPLEMQNKEQPAPANPFSTGTEDEADVDGAGDKVDEEVDDSKDDTEGGD